MPSGERRGENSLATGSLISGANGSSLPQGSSRRARCEMKRSSCSVLESRVAVMISVLSSAETVGPPSNKFELMVGPKLCAGPNEHLFAESNECRIAAVSPLRFVQGSTAAPSSITKIAIRFALRLNILKSEYRAYRLKFLTGSSGCTISLSIERLTSHSNQQRSS